MQQEEKQPLRNESEQQSAAEPPNEVLLDFDDKNDKQNLKRQGSVANRARQSMSTLNAQMADETTNYSVGCCGIIFAILFGIFIFNSNYQGTACNAQVLLWAKLTFYCLAATSRVLSVLLLSIIKRSEGSQITDFYTFLQVCKFGLVVWSVINFIALLTLWNAISTCSTLGTIIFIYLIIVLSALGLLVLIGLCCCCCICCAVVVTGGMSASQQNSSLDT